jgi:hypothetical protein
MIYMWLSFVVLLLITVFVNVYDCALNLVNTLLSPGEAHQWEIPADAKAGRATSLQKVRDDFHCCALRVSEW